MDWQTYLFDLKSQWITRFERMAKRRLIDPNLADQALEQSLAKLQQDNWARLGAFQAANNPAAFLSCVYRRLLEDFAIARFGKCRAPVWVQQLGLSWTLMYKRLCCERQAVEAVLSRVANTAEQLIEQRQIARTIKAKIPQCGQHTQFQSLDQLQDDHADTLMPATSSPGSDVEQQLCDDIVAALAEFLQLSGGKNASTTLKPGVLNDLDIDIDTRLLLKMIYQDDVTLPKAAAILGIAEHTARRQCKAALGRIQQRFAEAGFDWQDWSKHHD